MAKESGKSKTTQAAELGSKGGKKGGPARATKLSAQERSDIAKKGAAVTNANKKK